MKKINRLVRTALSLCGAVAISLGSIGCADGSGIQLADILNASGSILGGQSSQGTVVAGLKEALRVGTERTVSSASSRDGFDRNSLIRIPLPEQLQTAAKGLRLAGFGAQVDELELSMNRAAEKAASQAAPVFVNAITSMSFTDAQSILGGGERAATDYFEGATRENLASRFSPIVDQSMQEVGLVRTYDDFVRRLPFQPSFSLQQYVTDRSLDGLFTLLAGEEKKIREDPAARTTELLRTVFGNQ